MNCTRSFAESLAVSAGIGLVILLLLAGGGAVAQESAPAPPQVPAEITSDEARDLVARLSDDQVRALLLQQLDRVASERETAGGESSAVERMRLGLGQIRGALVAMAGDIDDVPGAPGQVWSAATGGGSIGGGKILLGMLLLLGIGFGCEWLFRRSTRGVLVTAGASAPTTIARRAALLALLAVIDFLGVTVFAIGAIGGMFALTSGGPPVLLVTEVLGAVIVLRAIAFIGRAVLAPFQPSLRIFPLADDVARHIYWRALIFAGFLVVDRGLGATMHGYGVDQDVAEVWRLIIVLGLLLYMAAVIVECRRPVAKVILAGGPAGDEGGAGFRQRLAGAWHLLAIVYVVIVLLLAVGTSLATGVETLVPALISIGILFVLPLADVGLQRLVRRMLGPDDEAVAAPGAGAGDMVGYEALALRNLRFLLALFTVTLFARLWSIDVLVLVEQMVGGRLAGALLDIGLTALLAYVIWGIVRTAVERFVGPENDSAGPGEGDGGGAGATRLATLLPIIRKAVLITLLVMVALIALSALGVDIGPLLAGAGVIGLAVGFGAQTLVRDVISGFFFLLDDAFRMGEYVEIGDIRGTVERISVRSLQLRHHNGPVHTIPFGDIGHVTNYSRDWAIMKFELRLPYETDIDRVRKIIKKVGQEMIEDENLSSALLAPLKSQGVNRMDDSALIVRCKFTAKPGEQFVLRREAYTRIQLAFEENGIKFAPRRVIVETSSPDAAAAAAAAAVDSTQDQQAAAGAEPAR